MKLIIEGSRSGESGRLDLEGFLDREGGLELKRRAVRLLATGCNEISVNLEGATGADPEGVEALAGIEALLPSWESSLNLLRPGRGLHDQLIEAGLGELIKTAIAADYEEAEIFGLISAGV